MRAEAGGSMEYECNRQEKTCPMEDQQKKRKQTNKQKNSKPSIPDHCNLLGTNAQCYQIFQVFRKVEKMDFLMLKYPDFFFFQLAYKSLKYCERQTKSIPFMLPAFPCRL